MKKLLTLLALPVFAQVNLPLPEPVTATYQIDHVIVEHIGQPSLAQPDIPFTIHATWSTNKIFQVDGVRGESRVEYRFWIELPQEEVKATAEALAQGATPDELKAVLAAAGVPEGSLNSALIVLGMQKGTAAAEALQGQ
jgi:hypothetical protein